MSTYSERQETSKSSNSEGKEQQLHNYIFGQPEAQLAQLRGNPQRVLDAIDKFVNEKEWLMNIGPEKGQLVINRIRDLKPKIAIELGAYVGYSAINFAKELPESSKYFCFEISPEFASITRDMVELAGLADKVQIIIGPAGKTLVDFAKSYAAIDFVFIDHYSQYYVPDLRVLESLKLIKPGTLIAADNVEKPGAPEYVEYVTSTPEGRKQLQEKTENTNGTEFPGDWTLVYDSKIEKPREDYWDAVQFTMVKGYSH